MPKMIVSIDGVVIKEVALIKERTTLGRRPYNDIVIDNLAVSGEHAVLHMAGDAVEIEDIGSTNGTYVNGQPVKRQPLRNGDLVEVGKYKIRFVGEGAGENYEKTMVFTPGMLPPRVPASRPAPLPSPASVPLNAAIRVMSGAAAGREVDLVKVVTTIGKPGVAVASITKRHHGFVLAHVEGAEPPRLNGQPITAEPVLLKDGDRLGLAGTDMEFRQR
ncbi:FHA domain-containing protein [Paracidovorax cattleyae]|uniref:FHA domain-containing protein n=1 Tax=Paracidovorax cattleyae TaxID=80868 RepID=A0A1H0P7K4_9BURK|nr:FHA domain-containing protein [Paracidovorax cattleyae]AVS76098.1 FHA domain-containing protein [Paracidovorax cattleyae]MBF9264618.1 FHA domain-containing protein [Paracidovorax cattleyae]SDP00700.1 FHA domain-containing protein [Paracidovorax cattleyae]